MGEGSVVREGTITDLDAVQVLVKDSCPVCFNPL